MAPRLILLVLGLVAAGVGGPAPRAAKPGARRPTAPLPLSAPVRIVTDHEHRVMFRPGHGTVIGDPRPVLITTSEDRMERVRPPAAGDTPLQPITKDNVVTAVTRFDTPTGLHPPSRLTHVERQ